MDKWTNRPEDRPVDAVSRRYKICRRRVNDLFRKHAGGVILPSPYLKTHTGIYATT